MNVWVPYTAKLRPETAAAAPSAQFVDVAAADTAYWDLLASLWRAGETFILVEHDIVPPDGALDGLWACERDWCGLPYPVGDHFGIFNGCTKFGAALLERFPLAVEQMRSHHWASLDSQLIAYLQRQDPTLAPHIHWPAAQHLSHEYDTLSRVFANCGACGAALTWETLRLGPEATCPRCGVPPAEPLQERRLAAIRNHRRNPLATRLRYVGDGSRYLHEDAAIGLEAVPPADFETDSTVTIAIALESGLYELAEDPAATKSSRKAATEADATAAAAQE